MREYVDISISSRPESNKLFEIIDTYGGFSVCVGDLQSSNLSTLRESVQSVLSDTLAKFIELMAPLGFSIEIADAMAEKDFAIDRAFGFSNTITEFGSFLDDLPFELLEEDGDSAVEYIRNAPLVLLAEEEEPRPLTDRVMFGKPPEGSAVSARNHKNVLHRSIIDQKAWDKARWLGLGHLVYEDGRVVLAFIFENSAGEAIFTRWKEKGKSEAERIRIGIIKGIDRENPLNYRVVVTSVLPSTGSCSQPTIITSLARMKTIEPESLESLNRFEKAFDRVPNFAIVSAFMDGGELRCQWENVLAIGKNALSIVEAHEIAEGDYVSCLGLLPIDEPVVPKGCTDAYVLKVIEEKRKRGRAM